MSIRTCRACRTPKWGSDPCTNVECPTQNCVAPLRGVTKPVTVTVKHGFHATTTTNLAVLCDYDLPMSARSTWKSTRP